jgi:hypothetical protein
MANALKDHINKLNAAHTSSADSDNPVRGAPHDLAYTYASRLLTPVLLSVAVHAQVYQIVEILNAHLHSLQWVEDNSNQLHGKLKTLRSQFKAHQDQQDHLRRIRNDYYHY